MTTTISLSGNVFSATFGRPKDGDPVSRSARFVARSRHSVTCFASSFHESLFISFVHSFSSSSKFSRSSGNIRTGSSSCNGESNKSIAGEDSAAFDFAQQRISSWIYFFLVLGVVLCALKTFWISDSTGFGQAFVDSVSYLSKRHEVTMFALVFIFAAVHSGLAWLRNIGEKFIGKRAYRVLFSGISLPLAVSIVVYFINHRYDGIQLWQIQRLPGVHLLVWVSSFVAFIFLYPSTFNLLEVAAIDSPKMHLWETGIMRITRHPQMVGQVIWCFAHTLWIGNSVVVAASVALIAHHLFGAWHGDKRLAALHGEAFQSLKSRTSIIPFFAIIDGRQQLPADYLKEFLRLPYFMLVVVTLIAYFTHPLM